MKFAPVAASVLAIPAFAAAALAGTLKVPSDDYPTIQSAVDAAVEGDTVLVGPGVYAEAVTISGKTGIRIKGKGHPTIQPGAAVGVSIVGSTGIQVTGLNVLEAATGVAISGSADVSITRTVVSGSTGNAFSLDGNAGVLISRCEVAGSAGGGVVDSSSDDLVVEKCSFRGITGYALHLSPYNLFGSGSDRAKVSKNRITGSGGGMRLGGADVLVEKNRIQVDAGYGIYFDSSSSPANAVVAKNVVATAGSEGIYTYGISFDISRNRLTGGGITEFGNGHLIDRNAVTGGNYGIYSNGSGTTVTRNAIRESAIAGIHLGGYFLPVEGNRVSASAGNGIVVNNGGAGPIAGNKVADCDQAGIAAYGGGNTFTGNKVTACDVFGFYVTGTGNTFSMNKGSGNGLFDLADSNAPGVNTYAEDNRFGTQQIPYLE